MTPTELEQLQAFMQQCFRYDGPYTLSSGRESNYYYDGRGATQYPPAAWLIGKAALDLVLDSGAEAVGGLEIGAVPIADAIGLVAHVERGIALPTFIVRKVPKEHGIQSKVSESNMPGGEALLRKGRKVAVVDDALTTGGSIRKAIDAVRELGCVVSLALTLVERHESIETNALRGEGFPVARLFYTDADGRLSVDADLLRRAQSTPAESPIR